MNRTRIALALLLAAVPVFLLYGEITAQEKEPGTEYKLFVCQDEATVELKIMAYLEKEHEIKGKLERIEDDPDDIYIEYSLEPDGIPAFTVFLDTESTETGDEGNVLERRIEVWGYYEVPEEYKNPETRAKILELNNKWMDENWMPGGIYVDDDGDIAFQTNLNIPLLDVWVHAEMVYDLLARTKNAWRDYYPDLKKLFTPK